MESPLINMPRPSLMPHDIRCLIYCLPRRSTHGVSTLEFLLRHQYSLHTHMHLDVPCVPAFLSHQSPAIYTQSTKKPRSPLDRKLFTIIKIITTRLNCQGVELFIHWPHTDLTTGTFAAVMIPCIFTQNL